ncbi:MAG: hypothetical protein AAGF55_01070 [Pseudomonadota bacterium]
MDNSNEEKMTIEEKIVQKIKSDTLMSLVGDEDAITKLAERAIQEALYQPRRKYDGYRSTEEDSVAVEAAREVAKKAAESVCEKIISEMLETDDFRAKVHKTFVNLLPQVLIAGVWSSVRSEADLASSSAIGDLRSELFRSG